MASGSCSYRDPVRAAAARHRAPDRVNFDRWPDPLQIRVPEPDPPRGRAPSWARALADTPDPALREMNHPGQDLET